MDYRVKIPAGESRTLQAPGDYVYVKSCPGEIRVVIEGRAEVMMAGDKRREARRFREVLIENDSAAEQAVTLSIGDGDYWRQIVQGEISVTPTLTTLSGAHVTDSRHDVRLYVDIVPDNIVENAGDVVSVSPDTSSIIRGGLVAWGGYYWSLVDEFYTPNQLRKYDPVSGAEQVVTLTSAGGALPAGSRNTHIFGSDAGVYMISDVGDLYAVDLDSMTYSHLFSVAGWGNTAGQHGGCIIDAGHVAIVGSGIQGARIVDLSSADFVAAQFPAPYQSNTATGIVRLDDGNFVALLSTGSNSPLMQYNSGAWVSAGVYPFGSVIHASSIDGKNRIVCTTGSKSKAYTNLVGNTVTYRGRGRVVPAAVYLPVVQGEEVLTQASIVSGGELTRPYIVTGEVIRAALDMWLGAAPDDYLDYIHAVEYPDPDYGWRRIDTGGDTFARAGVRDEFRAVFPGEMVITFRGGM